MTLIEILKTAIESLNRISNDKKQVWAQQVGGCRAIRPSNTETRIRQKRVSNNRCEPGLTYAQDIHRIF